MNKILFWPARYLDITPMYMVVLHALSFVYLTAIVTSVFGYIGFSVLELLFSGAVIIGVSLLVSYFCALVSKVPAQHLSSLITALILVLLIMPSTDVYDLFSAGVISALAIASKYVFIFKKQHVVNPVVAGLVLGSILGFGGASWWSSNPALFIPILVGGLFVVAKVRRFDMVAMFLSTAYIMFVLEQWTSNTSATELFSTFWLSYPFVFLACYMLTEPFTMPSRREARLLYATVVAVLVTIPAIGPVSLSPEAALLVGNIAFAPWSLRQKLILKLASVQAITAQIFEFTFLKPAHFKFLPGQYMEWMLPHKKSDSRGIRRYFTITSAPDEEFLRLAFKVPVKASSYKQAMMALPVGGVVIASQLAGDFILPKDTSTKLGFIAGGIGVTPFVSHITEANIKGESRDIVSFYGVQSIADMAYGEVLMAGGRLIPVISNGEVPEGCESGYLTAAIIKKHCADFLERTWYISGPPIMVDSAYTELVKLGVSKHNIKRDFFPGLA